MSNAWKNVRLKNYSQILLSNIDKKSYDGEDAVLLCNYTDVYKNKRIHKNINFMQATASKAQIGKLTLRYKDVIITKDSESADDIGIPSVVEYTAPNLVCGYHLAIIRSKKLNGDFISYLFQSKVAKDYFLEVCLGFTRVSLNKGDILNFKFNMPPLPQQTAIANYLDHHTTKLDKEISLLEQKVEKLDEYKQSLIYETVTKGLDKNVPMKDSGIEWIGMIPKHWETIPLKKCLKERVKKNKINDTYITNNILSVMKDVGVINHKDKGDVGNKMSEDISNYKLVYPNDIVINKMNVTIGSLGISKEFGALSVVYMVFKETKGNSNKFFNYLFKCKKWQKYLRTMAAGILEIRESVDSERFFSQPLIVPGVEEQNNIVSFLDEQCSKIDKKKELINKKRELLKEYKQSLIYEAVTGKFEIRA